MESERDGRIRKRAHEIWEQEGRPHGKDGEHWERAQRELDAADMPPLANVGVKKKSPSARTGSTEAASARPAATPPARKV